MVGIEVDVVCALAVGQELRGDGAAVGLNAGAQIWG